MTDEPIDAIDIAKRHPGLAPNVRGALWMLASALAFSVMTTLVKYLGNDYPAALQTFYRQAAGFVILLPIILIRGRAVYATTRPWILLFRSSAGTSSIVPVAMGNTLHCTRSCRARPADTRSRSRIARRAVSSATAVRCVLSLGTGRVG